MALDVEPDRDDKPRHVLVQMPGYVAGARRESANVIAAGGSLALRFDGDATVTLTGLPGVSLGDDGDCAAFAAAVQLALSEAAQAGGYTGPEQKVVVATARLAELANSSVRWDPESRRFAVSSGRQGVTQVAQLSSVEVLASAGSLSAALGFDDGVVVTGRLQRHKLPPPRAMTMDVRLDLWASTQPEIASLSDALCRLAPTRGAVRTLPALLAADVEAGADTLTLLSEGEPTLAISLVHLEAAGGARDRVSGRDFSPTVAPLANGRIELDAAHPSMALRVLPTPLVPSPFDAAHPLPRGVALTLGVQLAAGGADGQTLALCALTFGGDPVLALSATLVSDGGALWADVTAIATFIGVNGATATASSTRRLALSRLEEGLELHAAVVAATGTIELFAAGEPQALDDPAETPVPPVAAVGVLSASTGMMLVVGNAPGNPLDLSLSHLHLRSEPVGPLDPDLRRSLTAAARFPAGKRIEIARRSGNIRATLSVIAVSGNTLKVSPELPASFSAGDSQVFSNEWFFQQISLRRKDDLANHLYRLTGDYRVSAALEQDVVEAPTPAVQTPVVDVSTLGAGIEGGPGGPGAVPVVV